MAELDVYTSMQRAPVLMKAPRARTLTLTPITVLALFIRLDPYL